MHDPTPAPLAPVRDAACALAYGAPVLSGPWDTRAAWYPGTWLADPEGSTLTGLIKYVTETWGCDRHVGAALAFKGYAWAAALPVLVGWFGHGVVPMLESPALRVGISDRLPFVRFDISGVRTTPVPAAGARAEGDVHTPEALAPAARASLLDGHLADVIEALAESTRVGRRLLWGSLAETVALTTTRIAGPDGARRALELLGPPVADLVELTGGSVRRRTCCLWFASDTGRDQYCASCPVC